jgi:hypothetical protein
MGSASPSGGAPWTGLPSTAGLLVSAMAMIVDLLSSFVKRRMKLVPGSMALALDQIPESLLPAIDPGEILDKRRFAQAKVGRYQRAGFNCFVSNR